MPSVPLTLLSYYLPCCSVVYTSRYMYMYVYICMHLYLYLYIYAILTDTIDKYLRMFTVLYKVLN